MSRNGPRPVIYVCIAMDHESRDFVSRVIQATSQEDALLAFTQQTGLKAKTVHGPYRPKRAQVLENTRTLKFSDQIRKAIYNDWLVNAMILKEPENHAYLIFTKRIDDKKQPMPKGTIVVPISDLRFT